MIATQTTSGLRRLQTSAPARNWARRAQSLESHGQHGVAGAAYCEAAAAAAHEDLHLIAAVYAAAAARAYDRARDYLRGAAATALCTDLSTHVATDDRALLARALTAAAGLGH